MTSLIPMPVSNGLGNEYVFIQPILLPLCGWGRYKQWSTRQSGEGRVMEYKTGSAVGS